MKWHKIGLFLLTLLLLSVISLTAEALQVRICVPACDVAGFTEVLPVPSSTMTVDISGVKTTTVDITGKTLNLPGTGTDTTKRFTITCSATTCTTTRAKVVAQQSATLQKITFSTTKILAPTATAASGGCTTAAPCSIQIVATSHHLVPGSTTIFHTDFPTAKPTGGYPAGAFMAGFFTGAQPTGNGDTISMTAEASGLSATNTPLNNDVVNATPGAGSGDTAKSLPSSCTGSPTCRFMATTALKSFNTQISETVQQVCNTSPCGTRLRATFDISFKTPANSVNLPGGIISVDPPDPEDPPIDQTALLIAETLPPFENLEVEKLLVHDTSFALKARFTLAELSDGIINPVAEEVYLRVGPFAMTIPAGKFRKFLQGKLFTVLTKVENLDVAATFVRDDTNPEMWTFGAGVHGADLTGLAVPPDQVSVDLGVGNDLGSALTTAVFF